MSRLRRVRSLVRRRLGTAVTQAVLQVARRGHPPSARAVDHIRRDLRRQQVRAGLFELLSRGHTLTEASIATIRSLLESGRTAEAVSFADALASVRETETAGHLAAGVVAVHRRLPDLACAEFRHVTPDMWRMHAISEFLDAIFRSDADQLVPVLRDLVENGYADVSTEGWFEVVKYTFAVRSPELTRQAFRLLTDSAARHPEASNKAAHEIAWLRPWVEPDDAAPPALPDGHVPFALIDYRQPGYAKTSRNIGDHIQTLASLGHLVRHQNVRFHGDEELVGLVQTVQQRVEPDRQIVSPPSDVELFVVDRDASSYANIPDGTWTYAFGWYLHPVFGLRHDFPLHPSLRPIFVSFHCNKRAMLSPAAIEYLRRYGPVGCRDWTTVDLLLSIGVPAFFSGCLTTTVDTVYPALGEEDRPVAEATVYVDVPEDRVPAGAPTVRHSYPAVRARTLAANLREAMDLLDRYRRKFTKVVTSRLHCYLPVRALGLDVDFQPKNRADVRFNGLVDIDDLAFEAIRHGMLSRLETITTAILAGRPEAEIYQLWNDINADAVAAARARHSSPTALPAPSIDVLDLTRQVRAKADGSSATDPTLSVEIACLVGPGDLDHLPNSFHSLLAQSSRPVRLWVLARGCGPSAPKRLIKALPRESLTWMPCDDLPIDARLILLPELLPELDRVTVLPPAAVVLGDIVKLAEWDLGETPLAARAAIGTRTSSGFQVFYRAAKRLKNDAPAAYELYRHVHSRHAFDFDAFDTDVLVLDLARMREDAMTIELVPYIERFGLTAPEALILYAGPNWTVLPPEWAHVPTDERITEPLLVHWPRPPKPWLDLYAARRELWRERAAVHATAHR